MASYRKCGVKVLSKQTGEASVSSELSLTAEEVIGTHSFAHLDVMRPSAVRYGSQAWFSYNGALLTTNRYTGALTAHADYHWWGFGANGLAIVGDELWVGSLSGGEIHRLRASDGVFIGRIDLSAGETNAEEIVALIPTTDGTGNVLALVQEFPFRWPYSDACTAAGAATIDIRGAMLESCCNLVSKAVAPIVDASSGFVGNNGGAELAGLTIKIYDSDGALRDRRTIDTVAANGDSYTITVTENWSVIPSSVDSYQLEGVPENRFVRILVHPGVGDDDRVKGAATTLKWSGGGGVPSGDWLDGHVVEFRTEYDPPLERLSDRYYIREIDSDLSPAYSGNEPVNFEVGLTGGYGIDDWDGAGGTPVYVDAAIHGAAKAVLLSPTGAVLSTLGPYAGLWNNSVAVDSAGGLWCSLKGVMVTSSTGDYLYKFSADGSSLSNDVAFDMGGVTSNLKVQSISYSRSYLWVLANAHARFADYWTDEPTDEAIPLSPMMVKFDLDGTALDSFNALQSDALLDGAL